MIIKNLAIEFSDLYKIYIYFIDYNINKLLLQNESKIINNEYLEDFESFFQLYVRTYR